MRKIRQEKKEKVPKAKNNKVNWMRSGNKKILQQGEDEDKMQNEV